MTCNEIIQCALDNEIIQRKYLLVNTQYQQFTVYTNYITNVFMKGIGREGELPKNL